MVVRLFSRHSALVCVVVLAAVVATVMVLNWSNTPKEEETRSSQPAQVTSKAEPRSSSMPPAVSVQNTDAQEMRAVWVPFMSLDMSKAEDKSEAAFRKKFDAIVTGAKAKGMNALIVQVRPFSDALYASKLYPWSHLLTGTQGQDPGYDPMKYMVESAHKAGLELHAWLNPLRVQTATIPASLAANNPYVQWKADPNKAAWCAESGEGKYYNPAYAEVRKMIANGAAEIAKNYGVDGIQFDDYFYPTQDAAFDKPAYDAYTATAAKSGAALSLAEWRKANISALVAQCYREIKAANPACVFGIAPQGNVQNDLNMGADVKAWCATRGYVDYICPQLYVNFENPVLPFGTAAQTWRNMTTSPDVKLYLGLAVYKAGSGADSGTWQGSTDILAKQVSLGREIKCDGFMFYSWDYLSADQTKEEVANVIKLLD